MNWIKLGGIILSKEAFWKNHEREGFWNCEAIEKKKNGNASRNSIIEINACTNSL